MMKILFKGGKFHDKADPSPSFKLFLVLLAFFGCTSDNKKGKEFSEPSEFSSTKNSTYRELVDLFKEWREFQKPEIQDMVPDYTFLAMEKQAC